MAQRDMVLTRAMRTNFVHFDGPGSAVYLTESYPDLPPTPTAFAGCQMPNPDIGPLIKQWRPRHLLDSPTQTILDLRNAIWSQKRPSPRGGDVLLLAAGPSLGENLINVQRYREHATVIALNRAVMVVPNPDVFFCLERQSKSEWWKESYFSMVDRRTAVVCCPSTEADIVDHFPAPSRWYCITPWCGFDRWTDAPPWALQLPHLPTCETTISACLAFCALLEPKRIILVGTDHAWKIAVTDDGNQAEPRDYYCDGDKWPGPPTNIAGLEGVNGRYCVASYYSMKHAEVTESCCRAIQRMRNIEIINASGHGIIRHNVQNDFFYKEIQGRKEKAEAEKAKQLNERFNSDVNIAIPILGTAYSVAQTQSAGGNHEHASHVEPVGVGPLTPADRGVV